ncbi:MAG TPA: LysE family transporter [Anaerolineales bacterium]|nr:LysE family transporter [Anaerolineales bacterium]
MWLYLVQGFGLGFAAAVQPGPFQTYLISQALARGWRRTLIAAFAPLVSDAPVIAICLFVLSRIPAWFEQFLHIVSGIFILYLAFGAFKAWKDFESDIPLNESGSQKSLLNASLVNLLSPGPYLFWSLITGPILLAGWRESPSLGISFLLGFYAAFISSLISIIVVFGVMQRFGPALNRTLIGISALALFCFGLYQLWLGMS